MILSACGPALLAVMIEEFAGAAAHRSGLDPEETAALAPGMAAGTIGLLREAGGSASDLVDRVATRGGTTEVGVGIHQSQAAGSPAGSLLLHAGTARCRG